MGFVVFYSSELSLSLDTFSCFTISALFSELFILC